MTALLICFRALHTSFEYGPLNSSLQYARRKNHVSNHVEHPTSLTNSNWIQDTKSWCGTRKGSLWDHWKKTHMCQNRRKQFTSKWAKFHIFNILSKQNIRWDRSGNCYTICQKKFYSFVNLQPVAYAWFLKNLIIASRVWLCLQFD